MRISDIFSTIGILLAIIAFLPSDDREYIKLKFTKYTYAILLIIFVYIQFLVFYPWWYIKIDLLEYLDYQSFPKPKTWAYFITILTLVWLLYKILYSNFPKTNELELIRYYKNLYNKGNYNRISDIIHKYNLIDIENYFKNIRTKLNCFIVEEILIDDFFIQNTSSFNFELYESIINNKTKGALISKIYTMYFQSEINQANSRLNKYLVIHKELFPVDKRLQIITSNICHFESPNELTQILKNNLDNNYCPIINLIKLTHLLFLEDIKNNFSNIDYVKITELLTEKLIVTCQRRSSELDSYYFTLTYALANNSFKYPRTFKIIFDNIILINCKYYRLKNLNYNNILIKNLIRFSLDTYLEDSNKNISEIVKDSFVNILKQDLCNELRIKIYDIYSQDFKEGNKLFKQNIIDSIADF